MADKFNLGDLLQKSMSKMDAREQIEYIDLDLIDGDPRNFYSLDGIDELAGNIELVGLQQPLRVRPSDGRYVIVSGHRRAAALRMLANEGKEQYQAAPCIVEAAAESPEMQELRLIYANSGTRRMSSYDLARQAERVETLLYELKEQGVEFPGRMRQHVAEACQVSETRLARVKVIRENLIEELRPDWEAGKLKESVAYAFAQSAAESQRKAAKALRKRSSPGLWQEGQVKAEILHWDKAADQESRDEGIAAHGEEGVSFDAVAYAQELEQERGLLRKFLAIHRGPEMARLIRERHAMTRAEAINLIKERYRHRGAGGMKVDFDGKPNGLMIVWPHKKAFLARWADIFDQLALIAIEVWAQESEDAPPALGPQWTRLDLLHLPENGRRVLLGGVFDGEVIYSERIWAAGLNAVEQETYKWWMYTPELPGDEEE